MLVVGPPQPPMTSYHGGGGGGNSGNMRQPTSSTKPCYNGDRCNKTNCTCVEQVFPSMYKSVDIFFCDLVSVPKSRFPRSAACRYLHPGQPRAGNAGIMAPASLFACGATPAAPATLAPATAAPAVGEAALGAAPALGATTAPATAAPAARAAALTPAEASAWGGLGGALGSGASVAWGATPAASSPVFEAALPPIEGGFSIGAPPPPKKAPAGRKFLKAKGKKPPK